MRLMATAEGAEGDTEIATPLVRVDPGAATRLAFLADRPAMGCDAAAAVVPHAVAHWRSNVIGLW